LKNVIEAASARQKQAIRSGAKNMPEGQVAHATIQKRSLYAVNEHVDPVFNEAMAT
jgi:hypothetical protein